MRTRTRGPLGLKNWELALAAGVILSALFTGWLTREQDQLAGQVLRLHIVANSDTAEDQALKLRVRDRVAGEVERLAGDCATAEEAAAVMAAHLDELAAAGRAAVEENGYDYPVTAVVDRTWFPTKEGEGYALPAGEYTALRLLIGAGAGHNWWSVMFPVISADTVTDSAAQAMAQGSLAEDEYRLVTGEDGGYVIKFRAMELWNTARQALFSQKSP